MMKALSQFIWIQEVKKIFFSNINPLGAESVHNFGIFLNFNFPKNTFEFSESHSHGGLQRDKTSKK